MKIDRIGEYKIEYEGGPVVRAGYRIYKESWQTHRGGQPCINRRPRWRFISVHPTEAECRAEISRLTPALTSVEGKGVRR